ncbi:EpsG family protein [Dysgonomonas capnocytophagoides]|uniref:EpsG family protein n=1 Tax=Dysgonomonas capnocytophagoides TaxID=45254 RepID=UPI00334253CE
MFYYLISLFSIFLIFLSEKTKKQAIALISLMFLAAIGACRDNTIGTDVLVYGADFFRYACLSKDIREYFQYVETEPLYFYLNFIISRFTNEYVFMQLACQLLSIFPIYYCCYYWKQRTSLTFCMAIFILLFYFQSYNNIKQYISLAFILSAYISLLNKKYILYVCFSIIAILGHSTGFISILFLLIYLIHRDSNRLRIIFLDILFLLILLSGLFVFKDLLNMMLSYGADSRYSFYLENSIENNSLDKAKILTWIVTIFIEIYIIFHTEKKREVGLFLITTLTGFTLFFLGNILPFANRLALYFFILNIIGLPYTIYISKFNKYIKNTIQIGYFSILLLNFFYNYIYLGGLGQIYPYTSKILGFH